MRFEKKNTKNKVIFGGKKKGRFHLISRLKDRAILS